MIPIIDLSECDGSSEKLAELVRESVTSIGFLALLNHGLEDDVADMFQLSQKLFLHESKAQKERCQYKDNKGYSVLRQEILDPVANPEGDLKEAFNLGTIPVASLEPRQPLPPTFEQRKQQLAEFQLKCHRLCERLLEAFAIILNIDKSHFTKEHDPDDNPSILRFLRYPATPAGTASLTNRAGAHSDYGSLTLLFQLSEGGDGLQILPPWEPIESGKWQDAGVIENAVLVNIGDALEFWSGGKLKSTLHRVIVPESARGKALPDRYSIAYFCQPKNEAVLESVVPPSEMSDNDLERMRRKGVEPGRTVTSAEHLAMRLKATYTHKSGITIS